MKGLAIGRVRASDATGTSRMHPKGAENSPTLRTAWLLVVLMLLTATAADAGIVFSYPFAGSSGDLWTRGFYIVSYPGTNLSTVSLGYWTLTSGEYVTSLTARLGAYDGPIIGSTQVLTTDLIADSFSLVTYDFGGALVPTGSVVTFTQQLLEGPGVFYYDMGAASGPAGVIETQGTTPPLDTFRRDQVGVTITQLDGIPEPSTVLLLGTGLAVGLAALRRRTP